HGYDKRGTTGCGVGTDKEFVYAPGDPGVTRQVFDTGKPSRARNASEVLTNPSHKGRLYSLLWKEERHPCHSWYQFPLGSKPILGVMKVENKLDDKGPVVNGGFSDEDEKILELL